MFSRNPNWYDSKTLFAHDAEISKNSARAHYNYGSVLIDELYTAEINNSKKLEIADKAINELKKAIAINENYPEVYSYLTTCY